ncbi:MerR family DNA-binding transcriptional regulator [Allohahella marinimesophila]|uniref:MerR family DNA-binding transcriptional regulator n=1 Tax=Allohahella marinimesophila TaxID=1054972 RepID=A0ABP7QAZ4_9GAMM
MTRKDQARLYTISDLASEFDITPRTIRFYESEQLLQPESRESHGTRHYGERERVRLKLILRGKRLGFSLAESKSLIELYNADSDNTEQLQRFLELIELHRRQLQRQKQDIAVLEQELDLAEQRVRNAMPGSTAN